tara:strand:- start:762 stop:1019 length:258 start_codon:yes stop_codon:yes gene_type:complete
MSMSNSKIKYLKDDKVKLTMDLRDYKILLKGSNDLKNAVSMMHECHTIYLEDLGKLEVLTYRMQESMGFVSGKHSWSDCTIPTKN